MDAYRFFVPTLIEQLPAIPGTVALPDDDAHHARAVLRLTEGTPVLLFDGKGAWVLAELDRVAKNAVRAHVKDRPTVDEKPSMQLTLCTAVPKGERADWLIEQASQLNTAAVQWLDCEHSVVKPREGGGKMEKWRRLAVESAKQCGRTHLMQVAEPVSAAAALRDIAALAPDTHRILWLDPGPGGKSVAQALESFSRGTVTALIGPEGGWSDAERATLEQAVAAKKVHRVRLTQTTLRIETACAAIAAIIMSSPVSPPNS